MGFSRSHNDELNAFERGRAGADTPMLIQDNALPMSIQTADMKYQFGTMKGTFVS